MNPSILLINPPRSLYFDNVWKKINSCTPPFGLALLSAILKQRNIKCDILDCEAEKLNQYDIINYIRQHSYDFIGLTSTTVIIDIALELTKNIKQHFPDVTTILGGVHPTIFYNDLIRLPFVDIIIRNEGEESLVKLLTGERLELIPNLSYKIGEEIYHTDSNKNFYNLEGQPFLAYDKLPMSRYFGALGSCKRKPSIGMITSRGCPGKCTFCFSGTNKEMFGNKIRYIPAQKIVSEILFLQKKYNIKEISFYDDTFTTYKNNVIDFCNILIKQKIDLTWSCFARIDSVNEELLNLMGKAGCHQIMYGFEVGSPELLKQLKKKANQGNNIKVVELTRKAGISIRGAFMLGSPGETIDTLMATIQYAIQLKIDIAVFNITTPYPGTEMYKWAKENQMLLSENWQSYDLSTPLLKLENVSPEQLKKMYKLAYKLFFLRFGYFFQRVLNIKSYEDLKMNLNAFFALLKFR